MNTSASPPSSDEPDSDPSPTRTPRSFHIAFGITIGLALILAAWAQWTRAQLPPGALVPMHWDIHGHVNRFGHSGSLLLMPGVIAVVSLLLYALPHIESRRTHLLRSAQPYCAVWISVTILLGAIESGIILNAQGHHVPIASCAMTGAGLVLAISGNYLGKVRSNHIFGVRTPWTLRSEIAWAKTNRLGGRLIMGQGIVILCAALATAPPLLLLGLMFGGFFIFFIIVMVYSYRIWCHDAARHEPRASHG